MDNKTTKYDKAFLELAHKNSSCHKQEIVTSALCGCFYCETIFNSNEIIDWIEENNSGGETAICPKCGVDAVLSSKFPISDKQFLTEMKEAWF